MAQLKDTVVTGNLTVTGSEQVNGDVTLYAASGDSPALVLQRGTSGDTLNDYKIYDSGGFIKVKQQGNSGTTGFTQVAELTNQGKLTVSTPPTTDTTPSVSAWISPTDSAIKVSGTAVTPASGDYILLSDSSASNVASRGIAIGTSTSTYLRNDGTWGTPSGGGVTPSNIVVKGYDETGETTLYSGNLGSGLAVIEPLILDDAAVPELAIEHKNSGVTAGTYSIVDDTKTTNLYIPRITVDSAGHITDASSSTDYISAFGSRTSGTKGLLNSWDYKGLARGVNVQMPHLLSPMDGPGSTGYRYTFYPSSYTSSGYYSTTIYFGDSSKSPETSGFIQDPGMGRISAYDPGGRTITDVNLLGYEIVDVIFTKNSSITLPGGGTAYCTQPVYFDWACTNFSYNSTTMIYSATLYIYIDSSYSDMNSIYFYPVIKGYSGYSGK